jgi:glycosyltransferase A (GT-A) superfamily protein (DUF2064 family)
MEGVQLAVAISPADDESIAYFRLLTPPGTLLLPVSAPTIGGCLDAALSNLLDRGYRMAAAVSSDTPTVTPGQIALAFERLSGADVVYAPGDDGGFYLVGVKARHRALFSDELPWSTPEVMTASLARARELDLSVDLIPPMMDVDTSGDLTRLRQVLERLPMDIAPATRRMLEIVFPM